MYKYRNRIIGGISIAIVIYIVLLLLLDNQGKLTAGVLEAMQGYSITIIAFVILCQVLAGFFRFLEWHYYLGVIGARDKISVLDSAIIFVTGFVFVVSPGKAAELLKSVFLKIKTDVPIARSAPIVVAERVVDGIAVIVILVAILLFAGDQLNLGEFLGISQAIAFSSAIFLGICLVAVQIRPLAEFFLRIVAALPLIKRLHNWLRELYESSREVFHIRHVLITSCIGVGVYLASAAGFVSILVGFGIELTTVLIFQATFIVGVASAIGALSFVPNGAGVTEISNTAMLMAIVAPQNPELTLSVAAAAALLQGFFHKWFRVLVGLIVGVIFRNRLFTSDVQLELESIENSNQTLVAG